MQELPMGWAWANIDDLISTNGLFCDGDWIESKDQDSNGNVRLIQLADIGDGIFKDKSDRHLTFEKSIELGCTYLSNDDLLVARLPDPLGRACLFPLKGEKKYVTAVDICIVRPNYQHLNIKYLLYLINSPQVRTEIDKYKSGSTRKRISRKNFAKIGLSIASTPEQHRIVSKIEGLFSELDNGIENLKKAREQLKTYRQAVLKYAFEGKLTKEWRTRQIQAGNSPEPAEKLLGRIRKERGKHYKKQVEDWKRACEQAKTEGRKKPSKPKKTKELPPLTEKELAELPELSKGWCWAKIDQLLDFDPFSLKAGPFGSALKKSSYVRNGYKIYGQEQVIKNDYKYGDYYISEEKYQELITCNVKPKDILVSLVGTIGKILILPEQIEPGIINPRLIKISLHPKSMLPEFFKFYFESAFLKSLYAIKTHGATMNILNLGIIKDLPFPFCSIPEQQAIVQEIESRLSVCDKIEQTIEDSLNKAEALRQSILKKAFSGKLTRDWRKKHPELITGENSAEKLLEKIKAEKALVAGRKKPRSKKMKSKKVKIETAK